MRQEQRQERPQDYWILEQAYCKILSPLDYQEYLANYDSATFFKELGLEIKIGPSGTNVADVSLVLLNNATRKIAIIFGGEATVNVTLPPDKKPGFGGRNTHLALLAAEKLAQR